MSVSSIESSSRPRIGIVGATGAVGEVLLRVLEQRRFPASEIRPLASERSAGSKVSILGCDVEVQEAVPEALDDLDIVFFAATGSLSKDLAPEAVKRGAVVIDKSNTWRMQDDVPLVVPEINPEALDEHQGIIACPNCTTIGIVMALAPIRQRAGLRSIVVTTLQAVSGAGREGIEEFEAQRKLSPGWRPEPRFFAAPIEGNVVPLCESFEADGYSTEERKLLLESRKIFGDPELAVSMTCVRVPVMVGHSASLLIETEKEISVDEVRAALRSFPGIEVVDDIEARQFPTPLDVVGRDEVLVGRVRRDLTSERIWLWQVCDNLRKGAATNAVQIAEALIDRKLLGPRSARPG
jgi:aspartate-semialdehyde dehydrogenase